MEMNLYLAWNSIAVHVCDQFVVIFSCVQSVSYQCQLS